MMRIILGILIGALCVAWPPLPIAAVTVAAAVFGWLASQPLLVAFALGVAARPHLHMPKRWAK